MPGVSCRHFVLAGEPEAVGHIVHGDAYEVVQVPVGGGAQLESPVMIDVINNMMITQIAYMCLLFT